MIKKIILGLLVLPVLSNADTQNIKFYDLIFKNDGIGHFVYNMPNHEEQNAILGIQMFYCAGVADLLDKPFEALNLQEKGITYLDKWAGNLASFSIDHKMPDNVLNFHKPRYIRDKNIIMGMLFEQTISKVYIDSRKGYSLSIDEKEQLKTIYSDSCTSFLL